MNSVAPVLAGKNREAGTLSISIGAATGMWHAFQPGANLANVYSMPPIKRFIVQRRPDVTGSARLSLISPAIRLRERKLMAGCQPAGSVASSR